MKLYHTSNLEIVHPEIKFSRNHLNFGKGFYLTTLKVQAQNYGQRFLQRDEAAFLNIYVDDDLGCWISIYTL